MSKQHPSSKPSTPRLTRREFLRLIPAAGAGAILAACAPKFTEPTAVPSAAVKPTLTNMSPVPSATAIPTASLTPTATEIPNSQELLDLLVQAQAMGETRYSVDHDRLLYDGAVILTVTQKDGKVVAELPQDGDKEREYLDVAHLKFGNIPEYTLDGYLLKLLGGSDTLPTLVSSDPSNPGLVPTKMFYSGVWQTPEYPDDLQEYDWSKEVTPSLSLVDGVWMLTGAKSNVPVYASYLKEGEKQVLTLENQMFYNAVRGWGELYATTEYTGDYSEKFPPEFTDEFVYTQESTGIEVPIKIGLTENTPIKEVHLKDLGKEVLAECWLAACYYRYVKIMGNEGVTKEDYLELVKQGKGKVHVGYFDELTGGRKYALIDPRDGVSLTLDLAKTKDEEKKYELDKGPANAQYHMRSHFTINSMGSMILVSDLNAQFSKTSLNADREDGWTDLFHYSLKAMSRLLGTLDYFALLKPADFESSGVVLATGDKILDDAYTPYDKLVYGKVNPKTDIDTGFVSVVLR